MHDLMGERWMGYRDPAWHHLGTVFTEPRRDVKQAFMDVGAAFKYDECEVLVRYRGEIIPASEYKAIVREKTHDFDAKIMGIGSSQFAVIQNLRLAELIQPLADRWPIETLGVLSEGGTVFCTLDAGESKIAGEQHQLFFLISDGKKPGDGLNIAFTPIRVVCRNTLEAGLEAAQINSRVRHTIGVDQRVEDMIAIIAAMEDAQKDVIELFNSTAKKTLLDKQIEEIFMAAYPDPKLPDRLRMADKANETGRIDDAVMKRLEAERRQYENNLEQMRLYRATVPEVYDRVITDNPRIEGTGWAAYNAVVELQDFGSDRKGTERSAIFGERAKAKGRAFKKALSFV